MLAAMVSLSLMNVVLRQIAGQLHSTQIVTMRHIFSIMIVLLWASYLAKGIPSFNSNRMSGHFWRATFGILAMELWFYAVSIMHVTLATAISFITPIFSTILAMFFLGEIPGIRRWSAIITGFIGMLIILRPDTGNIDTGVWVAIAASLFMAGSGVMVKSLTRSEAPETIVFYMSVFMLLWSIPFSVPFWQSFSFYHLYMVFIISFFSTVAHLCMTRAFVRAELVLLMPFDFTRLIFTSIFAYLLLGETLDSNMVIGSAVIVSSTVYITYRETKLKKSAISQEQ